MEKPRFMEENYHYFDEEDELQIKEDAPQWAKDEYEMFIEMISPTEDEEGIITIS